MVRADGLDLTGSVRQIQSSRFSPADSIWRIQPAVSQKGTPDPSAADSLAAGNGCRALTVLEPGRTGIRGHRLEPKPSLSTPCPAAALTGVVWWLRLPVWLEAVPLRQLVPVSSAPGCAAPPGLGPLHSAAAGSDRGPPFPNLSPPVRRRSGLGSFCAASHQFQPSAPARSDRHP